MALVYDNQNNVYYIDGDVCDRLPISREHRPMLIQTAPYYSNIVIYFVDNFYHLWGVDDTDINEPSVNIGKFNPYDIICVKYFGKPLNSGLKKYLLIQFHNKIIINNNNLTIKIKTKYPIYIDHGIVFIISEHIYFITEHDIISRRLNPRIFKTKIPDNDFIFYYYDVEDISITYNRKLDKLLYQNKKIIDDELGLLKILYIDNGRVIVIDNNFNTFETHVLSIIFKCKSIDIIDGFLLIDNCILTPDGCNVTIPEGKFLKDVCHVKSARKN